MGVFVYKWYTVRAVDVYSFMKLLNTLHVETLADLHISVNYSISNSMCSLVVQYILATESDILLFSFSIAVKDRNTGVSGTNVSFRL